MLGAASLVSGFYYPIVPKAPFVHCQLAPLGRATAEFFKQCGCPSHWYTYFDLIKAMSAGPSWEMRSAAGGIGFTANLECALFSGLPEPFLARRPWEQWHFFFTYPFKFPKINLVVFKDIYLF